MLTLQDIKVGMVTNKGMVQTIVEFPASLIVGFSRPEIGNYDITRTMITADNVNEL